METNYNEYKPMNLFSRIKGVIIHPFKTFEVLGQNPKIGFPALAIGIGSAIYSLISNLYSKEILQKALEESTKNLPVESAQMAKSFGAVMSSPVISIISGIAGAYAAWFVMSLIYWGLVSLFGGKGTYKKSLTVWGYAWIAVLIGYIFKILYMIISGGPIEPAATTDIFGTLMQSNDIFKLWQLFLLVVGYSAVFKISKVKSAIAILGLWILGILYNIGSLTVSQNLLNNIPKQ